MRTAAAPSHGSESTRLSRLQSAYSDLFQDGWTSANLIRLHTAHSMTLLSHSTDGYNELGRMVAGARQLAMHQVRERYERLFMKTLRAVATTRKHTNVLRHMAGHLKRTIDDGSRRELRGSIEEYRAGLVPLIAPLTLIRHHVRADRVEYLAWQAYLEPHPRELTLRNHV